MNGFGYIFHSSNIQEYYMSALGYSNRSHKKNKMSTTAILQTIRYIQKYLIGARTIRDIDSNQKSVKYSVRRSHIFYYYFYFTPLFHFRECFSLCYSTHYKEIKVDDDCNMMMAQCIKIQKFYSLTSPEWNFVFEHLV